MKKPIKHLTSIILILAIIVGILLVTDTLSIRRSNTIYNKPITDTKIIEISETKKLCDSNTSTRCFAYTFPNEDRPLPLQVEYYDGEINDLEYEPGYKYTINAEIKYEIENPKAKILKVSDIKNKGLINKHPSSYILIQSPGDNETINTSLPLSVKGEARGLFEGNVFVEAKTDQGVVIGEGLTTMVTQNMGDKGEWEAELIFTEIHEGSGYIIVTSQSPKDSSEDLIYKIPVTFTSNKAFHQGVIKT